MEALYKASSDTPPPVQIYPTFYPSDGLLQRTVRILLECILVITIVSDVIDVVHGDDVTMLLIITIVSDVTSVVHGDDVTML